MPSPYSASSETLDLAERVFIELANKDRLRMLLFLKNNPARNTDLAREFGQNRAEITRNIDRLLDVGMVKKDIEGTFSITQIGFAIAEQIPFFLFISKNRDYFLGHTFGDLPKKFLQRLGELEKCTVINGWSRVYENFINLISNSEQFIYAALSEITSEAYPMVFKAIYERNIKLKYIMPYDVNIPSDWASKVKQYHYYDLISKKVIERKIIQKLPLDILMSERQALIMFKGKKDEMDMGKAFLSNDKAFYDWCVDYFRYLWNTSEEFDGSKMKFNWQFA